MKKTSRAWLEARRRGLTPSDMAAIIGVSGSAYEVFVKKTSFDPNETGDELADDDERVYWGTLFEKPTAEGYADKRSRAVIFLGDVLIQNPDPGLDWWVGSPDGGVLPTETPTIEPGSVITPVFEGKPPFPAAMLPAFERGLEIKQRDKDKRNEWGEPETDKVPLKVAIQGMGYMPLLRVDLVDVMVVFGGNEHVVFRIHRDDEILAMMAEAGDRFVRRHLLTGVAPDVTDGSRATREAILKRFPSHIEPLRDATPEEAALLDQHRDLKRILNIVKAPLNLVENRLRHSIGTASGLTYRGGHVYYKRDRDSVSPDWETVARRLAMTTPDGAEKLKRLATENLIVKEGQRKLRTYYNSRGETKPGEVIDVQLITKKQELPALPAPSTEEKEED